jgi:ribose 5-phosphate isomerase B
MREGWQMAAKWKVALGCDHAGFDLKGAAAGILEELGHEVVDVGTHDRASVDYPDFAREAAVLVRDGTCDRGLLLCGTGQGVAMVANKVEGVRCAVCCDAFSARMSRAHNDANMLALGSRVVGPGLAREVIRAWFETEFDGGRHVRRVAKIRIVGACSERKEDEL